MPETANDGAASLIVTPRVDVSTPNTQSEVHNFDYRILPGSAKLGRGRVATNKLYPFPTVEPSRLNLALDRLDHALEALDGAVTALEAKNPIDADNAMLAFAGILPDLFLCSSIGEGFAASVVGLNYALANKHPDPFSLSEVQELRYVVRVLKERPVITHDEAVDVLMKLEDSGLVVDPPVDWTAAGLLRGEGQST